MISTPPIFDVITFLPELYPGTLGHSIIGNALKQKLWYLNVHNIRDFSDNKHRNVDDKPTGGGAGMVLRAEIAAQAFDTINISSPKREIIYPSPSGKRFDQKMAQHWSQSNGKIFLCGRFEGVDQRVLDRYKVTEVSMGDFVLCGGDSAVQMMLEAIIRLLPNVVGKSQSIVHESFSNGLLEHAHYTSPRDWRGMQIPDVLLSGNHDAIAKWRHQNAQERTRQRRPDLWKRYCHD